MDNYDRFFILTNPLFWVFTFFAYTFKWCSDLVKALIDWYFVLFLRHKINDKFLNYLKQVKRRGHYKNYYWLRKKAFEYLFKKL